MRIIGSEYSEHYDIPPLTHSYGAHMVFSLMSNCEEFLVSQRLVKKKGEFFKKNPSDNAAHFIAAWIMHMYIQLPHCLHDVHSPLIPGAMS